MKTTYENTAIPTGISQIELRTVPTIPTGEDGYEPMRFSNNSTNSPPQALKEHGLISWKLAVLMAVIALAVSVISSVITGSIVYGKAKNDQDELKKSSEITNANINDLEKRLNYTLVEKPKPEHQLNGSNWDPWSNWGACTVECGGGLRSRSRQCNDDVCVGNTQEVELCSIGTCRDGGWSLWSGWSTCSVTCGGGIRLRDRLCNNPLPSPLGHYCPGHSYEVNTCNTTRCTDHIVSFLVTDPIIQFVNGYPRFKRVFSNIGGGYNNTSGVFTCTIPGLYHFFMSFTGYNNKSKYNSATSCCLGSSTTGVIVKAFTQSNNGTGYQTATAAAYLSLHVGDTVYLYNPGWRYIKSDPTGLFTGALITAA